MGMLADLIRPFWPNSINSAENKTIRVQSWLQQGDFEVNATTDSDNFELGNYTKSFIASLAYEIDRFSSSSLESISGTLINSHSVKSIPWHLVKAYYSSYYSAHAILRLCSRSCNYIDRSQTNVVEDVAKLTLPTPIRPSAGYYYIQYDSLGSVLAFRRKTNSNSGSHEFLWQKFNSLLNDILQSPLAGVIAYQDAILKLSVLQDALCRRGCNDGTWLSTMRNEVNYKFSYGVWHPYESKKGSYYESIKKNISNIANPTDIEIDLAEDDLTIFSKVVSFINSLLLDLISDLITRKSSRHLFLDYGFLPLTRQLKASRHL